MWNFEKEQKILDINGVKIGGMPGINPTALVGSIFYGKHKIVKDDRKGTFDKARAEELIHKQDEFSEKTGNPCLLDVVGASGEALIKHLEFSAEVSDSLLMRARAVRSGDPSFGP